MIAKSFSINNAKSQIKAEKEDISLRNCASTTKTGFDGCDQTIKECFATCKADKKGNEFDCIAKCPVLEDWEDVEKTETSFTVYYVAQPRRTGDIVQCSDMYVLHWFMGS